MSNECTKCGGVGWIIKLDEAGRDVASPCECQQRERSRRLMERSGISPEMQEKRFRDFNDRGIDQLITAKAKATDYVRGFKATEHGRWNSIIFCGQVGAGKTLLGIAICNNLIDSGIGVSYMAYRNDMTRIKQLLTNEFEYARMLDSYKNARVLYIDDLLKGRVTESDVNILYEIVNHRYMNCLPMIISTEKTKEQLLDFDEATGSRILEMCHGNIVQFVGRDLNYRLCV